MNRHARPHQAVQTSTLTDDTIKIRTHLRLLGASVIALSLWLSVSLALCSVNPELSTAYSHPLGRVSEWVSSGLLTHFGLVSFSLSVLLLRLGLMLVRFTIPLLSAFDLAAYALINLTSTFPLAVMFEGSTLLGTPYGGRFGELLAGYVRPLGYPYPLLISTLSLVGVVSLVLSLLSRFGAAPLSPGGEGSPHTTPSSPLPMSDLDAPELNSARSGDVFTLNPLADAQTPQPSTSHPEQQTPRLQRRGSLATARHVKSPSAELNARVDALLEREQALGLTPLELEPLHDEIDLTSLNPEGAETEEREGRLPLRTSNTPSLSALSTSLEPSIYNSSFHTPRDTRHMGAITQPPQDPYQERLSFSSHSSSRGASAHASNTTPSAPTSGEFTSLPSHHDLDQRSSFLRRALSAMGLSVEALQAEPGAVSSEFVLTLSPSAQRLSDDPAALFRLSVQLTSTVRASFGRMEPALLALPVRELHTHEERERLQVTWPQRSPQLARNRRLSQGAQRPVKHREDLVSYLGTLPNGRDIYLPFVNLPSLLITGGRKVDPYLGLNLLITELSYLTSEREMRYLIAEPRAQQPQGVEEQVSPFEGNAQLFTPVMYTQSLVRTSLAWVNKELIAREDLMRQHKLSTFKELVARSNTSLHRVVYLVPELNNLASDNIKLLTLLLDRLNRGTFDAGVHLLLNTRGLPNVLTRRVMKGCPRRLSLKASEDEAVALGEPSASLLMPHQQDMLLTLKQHPVRLHGWQLTAKGFKHFMRSIAQEEGVRYICEEGDFASLPTPQVRRSSPVGTHV